MPSSPPPSTSEGMNSDPVEEEEDFENPPSFDPFVDEDNFNDDADPVDDIVAEKSTINIWGWDCAKGKVIVPRDLLGIHDHTRMLLTATAATGGDNCSMNPTADSAEWCHVNMNATWAEARTKQRERVGVVLPQTPTPRLYWKVVVL